MSMLTMLAVGAVAVCAGPNEGFALRSGDRVAFYGDSITEHGHYTNLVESFVACRLPKLRIEFFGVGWAGDTTWGTTGWDLAGGSARDRVEKDVRPLKPTVITVMLGMNDGGYVPFDPKIQATFVENYEKLIAHLSEVAPHARITLIRTSPWDDVTRDPSFAQGVQGEGGYNRTLQRYGDQVRELATRHGFGFVDFNQPMVDAMARAKAIDLQLSQQIVPDWIHPGPPGGLLMANELLKAWGAPSLVSHVILNAKAKKVVVQDNARVSEYDGLSWTQLDAALPFPIDRTDKAIDLAAKCCDVQLKLNQQILQVSGLERSAYRLTIDGRPIATLTSQALEDGVNLADFDTPMMLQAVEVHRITVQKNRVFFAQWREVARPFDDWKPAQKATKAVDELRRALIAKQRQAAETKSHRFELVPV